MSEMLSLLEILNQRKYWQTGKGEQLERKKMTPDHKMNTLLWLYRNARDLAYHRFSMLWACSDDGCVTSTTNPRTWMFSTPMFQALLTDVMAAGLVPGTSRKTIRAFVEARDPVESEDFFEMLGNTISDFKTWNSASISIENVTFANQDPAELAWWLNWKDA